MIKFRKERANKKGVPLHYVFTDKELDKLIEQKPKTVDELKREKILFPDTKIDIHGEAIINVINN